jgi:hypothetical protein
MKINIESFYGTIVNVIHGWNSFGDPLITIGWLFPTILNDKIRIISDKGENMILIDDIQDFIPARKVKISWLLIWQRIKLERKLWDSFTGEWTYHVLDCRLVWKGHNGIYIVCDGVYAYIKYKTILRVSKYTYYITADKFLKDIRANKL